MRLALCLTIPALLSYQTWMNDAKHHVPIPTGTIVVHIGQGCGDYGSCVIREPNLPPHIWIAPEHVGNRAVFDHELGHIALDRYLTKRGRYRIRRILQIPDSWKWRPTPNLFGAEEFAASGYSLCARFSTLPAEYETQYGVYPTRAEFDALCNVIRTESRR